MELIVCIPFCDKHDTSIEYKEGQVIEINDIERVNDLIKRGLCLLTRSNDHQADGGEKSGILFRDVEYDLEAVKSALVGIGVNVPPNTKEKRVQKIVDKLTEEQSESLFATLNQGEE